MNKSNIILSILFISLIGVSVQQVYDLESSNLYTLTNDTFEPFLESHPYVLVKFYAPWCGHCKSMAPAFADAAADLQDSGYNLANVDCTVQNEVCGKFGVSGYPTLKFFINGKAKDFKGERTKTGIIAWIDEKVEAHEEAIRNKVPGEAEVEDNVYELTDENIDSFIETNPHVFVMFYSPGCGHCKKMEPALFEAAGILNEEGHTAKVAKLNASVNKVSNGKYGVKGYPTMKFFFGGVGGEYKGGREAKDLVALIKKKSDDPVTNFDTIEEVEEWKKKQDISVILFGGEEKDTFISFAVSYDNAEFGYSDNDELRQHYKAKEGGVVLFKNFDEKKNVLPGVYSIPTIKNWVENNSIPTLIEYEEKYNKLIYDEQRQSLIVFYDQNGQKADQIEDVLIEFSRRIKGRLVTIQTGIVEEEQKKFADNLGVKAADLPLVIIIDPKFGYKKYKMSSKKINPVRLRDFVDEWKNGKALKYIKSAAIPEEQGPVTVLVGDTWDEIVHDTTKDVFVEFYAPWCGHCTKLAPIWNELGEKMQHNKDLVIAKVDATENETGDDHIRGYPTIKFFPANDKKNPIEYDRKDNGETLEDFIKFCIANGSKTHTSEPAGEFDLDPEEKTERTDL
jgi:protein disulfide-isomerase-like protein